jgi:hypothetical protein
MKRNNQMHRGNDPSARDKHPNCKGSKGVGKPKREWRPNGPITRVKFTRL